ncbi:MAG: hypothetical protein IOMNBAOH_01867 [Rhodocyclaceae bacterium]|nr:hypothetical protein [Rhodocyclaceae bacterium]
MTLKRYAFSLARVLPTMTVSRSSRACSALAALVVSLALCSASGWTHGAEPLQEATRLARQGQHAQALERVEQILATRPKDPSARFLKGLILSEQGRSADAIAIFEKLSEDYPELPEPYNNLAVLYAQQRQYEKARAALEMAIRTHPSYATAYENLGDIYARLASQAYDKALQLDAGNVGAQSKLSLIREIFGIGSKSKPAAHLGQARADVAMATRAEKSPAGEAAKGMPDAEGADRDILRVVDDWAAAWSRRDASSYLAHYDHRFEPPKGRSREEWATERRQRIAIPVPIKVTVDQARVRFDADGRAHVAFRQRYQSGKIDSTVHKTLTLVEHDNAWRILRERVGA